MMAVILAGGFAKRLRPISEERAKPLLRIAGRPIVDHIIDRLEELEAVEGIFVAANAKFERQFREWLAGRPRPKVELRIEPALREEEKPGAIGALSRLLPDLPSGDAIVIAGDNLFDSSLRGMLAYYERKGAPVVAVYEAGDPELVRRCSAVEVGADWRIVGFEEKPKDPRSTLMGTCIYAFPRETLELIPGYLEEGSPDSPGRFLEWLYTRRPVYAYPLGGLWFDIGTAAAYEEAKRRFEPPRGSGPPP